MLCGGKQPSLVERAGTGWEENCRRHPHSSASAPLLASLLTALFEWEGRSSSGLRELTEAPQCPLVGTGGVYEGGRGGGLRSLVQEFRQTVTTLYKEYMSPQEGVRAGGVRMKQEGSQRSCSEAKSEPEFQIEGE